MVQNSWILSSREDIVILKWFKWTDYNRLYEIILIHLTSNAMAKPQNQNKHVFS